LPSERHNPMPDSGPPRVIAGRFELKEVLGNGGMAVVYHAWDRERRHECAVKVPAENLARDEDFRRRFRQEAEAARALMHPRIIRVYAHGEDGGTPYMAMEHVPGGTLCDLFHRRGPLPEALALRLAAEVADALAYAHERGVIHRDIKPHNILLTDDQHVKIADFGIARTLGETSHTKTGSVLGSTQYISPEQARGEHAGPASDQYSLGVVLYEALAGRLPFDQAETPVAMALKHIHEPPFDLQWLRPDVSEPTVSLVRRLLAKTPQDRYPSAAHLATALRRIYVRFGKEDAAATAVLPLPGAGNGAASGMEAAAIPAGRAAQGRSQPSPAQATVAAALGRATTVGSNLASRHRSAWSDTARISGWRSSRRGSAASHTALAVIGLLGLWLMAGALYQVARTMPRSAPVHPAAVASRPAPSQAPSSIQVPSFVGQTLADAQRAGTSQQLTVAVASSRQDAKAGAGVILSQDPGANTAVTKGATIHVVVSQGSGIVPDLRGASLDDARQRLAAAGLVLGQASQASDNAVAAGMVVSASPGTSTHLAPHTTVDVVVSQGPSSAGTSAPPSQDAAPSGASPAAGQPAGGAPASSSAPSTPPSGANPPAGQPSGGTPASSTPPSAPAAAPATWSSSAVVPNVTGVSLEDALVQLRTAGLRAGQVSYTHNTDAAPGVVIYQARVAGTHTAANDAVDLMVSQGPPGQTQPAPGPPAQSP
jgi:eukaryotic-like serine/threonine-protein kinase